MTKLFGAAVVMAALGLAGCDDRGIDRREVKQEVRELPPGEQTNHERAEKVGDELREAGRETKRQAREGTRELRRDVREGVQDDDRK